MSRGRGCGDSFLLDHKCQILQEKKDKSRRNRTPLYALDIHLYIVPYIYQHRNRRANLSWFCFFFHSIRQRHFSLQLQPSAVPPPCQSPKAPELPDRQITQHLAHSEPLHRPFATGHEEPGSTLRAFGTEEHCLTSRKPRNQQGGGPT